MAQDDITADEQRQLVDVADQLKQRNVAAVDICAIWKIVKPVWPIIVKAAGNIPRVGAIVAAILQWLGDAWEAHCKGR
jgi:hypothetical protein